MGSTIGHTVRNALHGRFQAKDVVGRVTSITKHTSLGLSTAPANYAGLVFLTPSLHSTAQHSKGRKPGLNDIPRGNNAWAFNMVWVSLNLLHLPDMIRVRVQLQVGCPQSWDQGIGGTVQLCR